MGTRLYGRENNGVLRWVQKLNPIPYPTLKMGFLKAGEGNKLIIPPFLKIGWHTYGSREVGTNKLNSIQNEGINNRN